MVGGGKGPAGYRELHRKYGQIVRVGPNHVATSDPAAIPVIYGLGSKYKGANHHPVARDDSQRSDDVHHRRNSTKPWSRSTKASPSTACSPPATQPSTKRSNCSCRTSLLDLVVSNLILRRAKRRSPATTTRRRPRRGRISSHSFVKERRSSLLLIHKVMPAKRSSTT
jgi:hypothetical protein